MIDQYGTRIEIPERRKRCQRCKKNFMQGEEIITYLQSLSFLRCDRSDFCLSCSEEDHAASRARWKSIYPQNGRGGVERRTQPLLDLFLRQFQKEGSGQNERLYLLLLLMERLKIAHLSQLLDLNERESLHRYKVDGVGEVEIKIDRSSFMEESGARIYEELKQEVAALCPSL